MNFNLSKAIAFIMMFSLISHSFAQSNFQDGYFINNSDEKIDCLINNEDWISNPKQFEYKLPGENELRIGNLADIKTFVVGEDFKYERVTVEIDRNIIDQQADEGFNFEQDTLYLKVLVEGDIDLYQLEEDKLSIFFIENNDTIEQLEYKSYYNENYKTRYNRSFRKQIYTVFNSNEFNREKLKPLEYKIDDLLDIFIEYNKSRGPYKVYYQRTKLKYNVYAKVGINSSTFDVQGGEGIVNIAFPGETSIRVGAEFELFIPYSKGKWSAFLSPAYRSYQGESRADISLTDLPSDLTNDNKVEYSSIEIPVGVRRYFFKDQDSKIKLYLNAAYFFDVILDNNLILLNEERTLKSGLKFNFVFGGGLQYDKLGIEFLYFTPRDLVEDIPGFQSDFKNIAVNLSYRLF